MRKILVPIAQYESCIAALDLGGRLSKSLGADLTILHTIADLSGSHLGSGVATGKLAEWGIDPPHFKVLQQARIRLQAQGLFQLDARGLPVERHSLKALAQGLYEIHLVGNKGQNVRFRLREGSAARVILNEAEDPLYDLIITGTRGHRGLKRLLSGSISQEIALHAPCSHLVAKNLVSDRGILVGVTGRDTSQEAVRQAGVLAEALGIPIVLLAIALDDSGKALAEQHLQEAAKLLRGKGVQLKSMLQMGEPSAVLLREASKSQILTLGRVRRSAVKEIFLGDISLKILDKATGPVLITSFPRTAPEIEPETAPPQTDL